MPARRQPALLPLAALRSASAYGYDGDVRAKSKTAYRGFRAETHPASRSTAARLSHWHKGQRPCGTTKCRRSRSSGKPRDPETGLDNFGARYNSSTLGRFMTPDWSDAPTPVPYASLASPQTLNLYAYSGNNPVSVVDRDGHLECYLDGAATPCGDAFNDVSTGSAGICPGTCSTFFNGQYYQYFFGAGTASGWESFGDIAAGLTEWDGQLYNQIGWQKFLRRKVFLARIERQRWNLAARLFGQIPAGSKGFPNVASVYQSLSFDQTRGGNADKDSDFRTDASSAGPAPIPPRTFTEKRCTWTPIGEAMTWSTRWRTFSSTSFRASYTERYPSRNEATDDSHDGSFGRGAGPG